MLGFFLSRGFGIMNARKMGALVPRRCFQLRASRPEVSHERTFQISKKREAAAQREELKKFRDAMPTLQAVALPRQQSTATAVASRKALQFRRFAEQCQAPLAKRLPLPTNTVLDVIKSACHSTHFAYVDHLLRVLKVQNRLYHRRISLALFRVLLQNGRLDDLLRYLLERGKYSLFCNAALLNRLLQALACRAAGLRGKILHHATRAACPQRQAGRLHPRDSLKALPVQSIDGALLSRYNSSFEKCLLSALQALHLFDDYMVRVNDGALALVESIVDSYVGCKDGTLVKQVKEAMATGGPWRAAEQGPRLV